MYSSSSKKDISNEISLQKKIIFLISSILILVILFSAVRTIKLIKAQRETTTYSQNNQLRIDVINLIGLHAEYRGLGVRLLANNNDKEIYKKFSKHQIKFKKEFAIFLRKISNGKSHNPETISLIDKLLTASTRFTTLESNKLNQNVMTSETWFSLHNELIDYEVKIADSISMPNTNWQWLGYLSELKHDAARYINYAGQERAIISTELVKGNAILASQKTISERYHSYVEELRLSINTEGIPLDLKHAISLFLNLYDNNLTTIKKELLSEKPIKDITEKEWWYESSLVIDAAQLVSYEAGRAINETYLAQLLNEQQAGIYKSIIELVLILSLMATLTWWLFRLVVRYIAEIRNHRNENHKYVRAVENSPVGIILSDKNGNVEYINRICREKVNTPKLGKPLSSAANLILSPSLLNKLVFSIKNGSDWQSEVKSLYHDNTSFNSRVISKPLFDEKNGEHIGALVIHDDISEQKRLEKSLLKYQGSLETIVEERTLELKLSEARTTAIFEMAVNSIITISTTGLVIQLNKSAEEMFGYHSQEVIGKNISMLMPDKYAKEQDSFLSNYLKTGIKQIIGSEREVEAQRKNGEIFPISLALSEVKTDKDHFFVGMITDISERKAFEESLEIAKDIAERASQIKSTFLASMSHEIRTPMNGVLGMTEIVLETDLTTEQRKHLSTALASAKSLLGILNGVLDLAKLESGQMTLSHIDFCIKDLLNETLEPLAFTATNKGLDFSLNIDDSMPSMFNGDPLRIRQVLVNLVGNAIKFTENGYVNVTVSYIKENNLKFLVKDSGIGIPKERISSIFDSFTQADAGITRKFGGTGLGTTISKQFVELMGGKIYLESELGKGSTFYFDIPLGECNVEVLKKEDSIDYIPENSELNILVAEDQATNQELIRYRLNKLGHQVTLVEDGNLALSFVQKHQYDLVLMDGHMPNLDGYEATKCIRKYELDNNKSRIPIIALTASVMVQDRQKCMECGMDGFVAKPIDFHQLSLTMDKVLNGRSNWSTKQAKGAASILNFEDGLNRWGGDKKLYQDSLNNFSESIKENVKDISNALIAKDNKKARFLIHSMKGIASNLQVEKLTDVLSSIEMKLDNKIETDPIQIIAKIKNAAYEFSDLVSDLYSKPKFSVSVVEQPYTAEDTDIILEKLIEIKNEIVKGKTNLKSLESIKNIVGVEQTKPLIAALDGFDFDTALSQINILIVHFKQDID